MGIPPRKSLLVVDDELVNRLILKKNLSTIYDIFEATNGKDAIDIVLKEKIDLIILDIQMPVMDGYQFLIEKKKVKGLKRIPVIVATQQNTTDDELRALTLGATDFVTKPFHPSILKNRVKNLLELEDSYKVIDYIKYDSTSGLFTKEYFYDRVRYSLSNEAEKEFDMIFVEMKNYGSLYKTLQSQALGSLVKSIANIIKFIIDENGFSSYLGNGLFAFFTPHRDYDDEFFDNISKKANENGMNSNVKLVYGVYDKIFKDDSVEDIFSKAMFSINFVKDSFTKCYKLYDEKAHREYLEEQYIESSMQRALKNDEFIVYYQPKYNILSDTIIGAEALVRWKKDNGSIIPPNCFIPIFERNGFITQLDKYVWEYTCKVLKSFESIGIDIPISVNISRVDFFNIDVHQTLIQLTEKYRIPREKLYLEITETTYNDDLSFIANTVNKIRESGFIVEMDDFGTGYSSLGNLSTLPVDILKLDMKFLQDYSEDKYLIMKWVIALAKILNLDIICEGLETNELKGKLIDAGCEKAQGYLYSKPIELEAFLKLYRESKKNEN